MLSLGVEKACCLYYQLSKMDIQLWQNINKSGETLEVIEKSTDLQSFNICFSGNSLFHYFASRSDVISLIEEIIHRESELRELMP